MKWMRQCMLNQAQNQAQNPAQSQALNQAPNQAQNRSQDQDQNQPGPSGAAADCSDPSGQCQELVSCDITQLCF